MRKEEEGKERTFQALVQGGATFFRTTFFQTTLVRTTFVRIDLSSKRRKFESTLVRTVIKTDFSSNIIQKTTLVRKRTNKPVQVRSGQYRNKKKEGTKESQKERQKERKNRVCWCVRSFVRLSVRPSVHLLSVCLLPKN